MRHTVESARAMSSSLTVSAAFCTCPSSAWSCGRWGGERRPRACAPVGVWPVRVPMQKGASQLICVDAEAEKRAKNVADIRTKIATEDRTEKGRPGRGAREPRGDQGPPDRINLDQIFMF